MAHHVFERTLVETGTLCIGFQVFFADSLETNVFKSLEGQPGITTLSAQYSGFNELAFNTGAALDDGTPANVAGLMAVLTTLTRMGLGRAALPAMTAARVVGTAFPGADLDSGLVNTDELDLAALLDHADAYVLNETIPLELDEEE